MEAQPKELDLFEFVDMLLRRKYLILSMIFAALIAASVYCYFLRPKAAKRYSIQMRFRCIDVTVRDPSDTFRDLNQLLGAMKSQFMGDTIRWFENRMYKANLQQKRGGGYLPDIQVERKGDFFKMKMDSRDPETGKQILEDVFTIFINSGLFINLKNDMNRLCQDTLEKRRIALENSRSRIGIRKDLLADYRMEIDIVDTRITQLRALLREIEEKGTASGPAPDSLLRRNLANDYETLLRDFIDMLEKRHIRAKAMIRWLHGETAHFEKQMALQKREVDTLAQAMVKIDDFLDFKEPYYEERPPGRRYSDIRIIGFTVMLAAFFGALIAFILGINERRQKQI